MSKAVCILLALVCLQAGIPFFALGQSNCSETLTITTYYPSPYGVYRNLEVKRGLAVGDITQGPLGSMDNLTSGQLYINNSVVLNALSTTPANSTGKAGQVIYVGGSDKMLKFHDGNKWVNTTSTCTAGQSCKPSNYVAPNTCTASGYSCLPNNYVAPCTSGQSCQATPPTVVAIITYQVDCSYRWGSTCPAGSHETGNTVGYCTSTICCGPQCGNQICCYGSKCPWSASCVSNSSS